MLGRKVGHTAPYRAVDIGLEVPVLGRRVRREDIPLGSMGTLPLDLYPERVPIKEALELYMARTIGGNTGSSFNYLTVGSRPSRQSRLPGTRPPARQI